MPNELPQVSVVSQAMPFAAHVMGYQLGKGLEGPGVSEQILPLSSNTAPDFFSIKQPLGSRRSANTTPYSSFRPKRVCPRYTSQERQPPAPAAPPTWPPGLGRYRAVSALLSLNPHHLIGRGRLEASSPWQGN